MMTTFEYRQAFLASMTEAEFQQQVIDYAHLQGWRVAWFRPVRVQRADGTVYYETPVGADGTGWPDLILVREGRGIAWELKSQHGSPSSAQIEWLNEFDAVGFETGIMRPSHWDQIEEALQ